MKNNAAKQALTNAVNKAIANGAPVYTNIPPSKKFRMTRTTVETVEVEAADLAAAQALADAANNGTFAGSPNTRTIVVDELHPVPVYRVVIMPDDHYDHGDYETEEDKEAVDRRISLHGVEGFSVEMQTTVNGKWEDVEDGSCWGFIGDDTKFMLSEAASSIPEGVSADVFYADPYGKHMTPAACGSVVGTAKK